jgi:prepilin-type N-terminal cleavage/methylation domain-containing protein
MTLRILRSINRTQKGFTLIEILIAIAITAIIGSGVAVGTYEIVHVNASSTNRQVAITNVENAVHYISRDAQQAQIISPANSFLSGASLTLQWITWDIYNNTNHTNVVTYSLSGTNLIRTSTIDGGGATTTTVAKFITTAFGTWNESAKLLTFTNITATVGAGASVVSETRTFKIIPRSAQ